MTTITEIENDSYLVGGAVRDSLLGQEPKDKDFVVVGHTPQEMIDAGFSLVGNDFPVFLHPETKFEYALARTERKSGKGHNGFITDYNPSVTLEEDLIRRDLTINSMAADHQGNLIDPFGGQFDLSIHCLRYTSGAFADDPLRVLRVARFATKSNDWWIDSDTVFMCRGVGETDEFRDLTAERVAMEMTKALSNQYPSRFFEILNLFDCLDVHFPEIAALKGQTQPEKWHPEGDAFVHTMEVVDAFVRDFPRSSPEQRFSALVHDFGKGLTPKEKLPHHYGHEAAGVPVVKAFCERLKLSNDFTRPALLATEFHQHVHNVFKMKAETLAVLSHMIRGNFREWAAIADVAQADTHGRGINSQSEVYPNREAWMAVFMLLNSVTASTVMTAEEIAAEKDFHQIRHAITMKRIKVAKEFKAHWKEEGRS